MSLFPEITSKNYAEYIEGIYVSYKYFINDQNVWWYCFDDIVEFTHMNESFADKLFSQLPDNEKETFEDRNYYDEYGHQRTKPRRFITSKVVRDFIERNNKRNTILIKSINNLEFKIDANELYFEDEELLDIMDKTKKALENKDYEEWAIQVNKAYHSESFRDIGDKIGIIDKEMEEAVDKIRDFMYKEEIKIILGKNDEDEILFSIDKENIVWNFNDWVNQ